MVLLILPKKKTHGFDVVVKKPIGIVMVLTVSRKQKMKMTAGTGKVKNQHQTAASVH